MRAVVITAIVVIATWVGLRVAEEEIGELYRRMRKPLVRRVTAHRDAGRVRAGRQDELTKCISAAYAATRGDPRYSLTTVSPGTRVPALHDKSQVPVQLDLSSDAPLALVSDRRTDYPYDERLVNRLVQQGAQLWDGNVLCFAADGIAPTSGFAVNVGNFFSVLSSADSVTRKFQGSAWDRSAIAEEFSSFEATLTSNIKPIGLGVDVACIFDDDRGNQVVALHDRSGATVNARGLATLTPALTPEPNVADGVRSRYGLLVYNALKEFLEEFWNEEGLERSNERVRADPDWVFQGTEGARLIEELNTGRLSLWWVGTCIDLTHAALVFSLVMRFSSPEYLSHVKNAPGCGEQQVSHNKPIIYFRDLHGQQVEELMTVETMKLTSLFTLDRARMFMSGPDAP